MIQSLRVFVVVGVMVLAASGCQKGAQSGAKENRRSSGVESDSKASEAQARTGESGTRVSDAAAGAAPVGGRGLTLTTPDDGTALDLKLGQVLTVVLPSNRSAGMNWTLVEPTATVIVPEGKPAYSPIASKAGASGSGGVETWRFRAAGRGQQTVRLEYGRAWQRSVPERTFHFTATVR